MTTSLDRSHQINHAGLGLKVKDVDVSGNVDVTGNVSITGTLAVTGAQTFTGLITATAGVSGGWKRTIVDDGASIVLTTAQSGALCVFDKADGALFTLPTAAAGLWFDFIVDTAATSSTHKVITSVGTEFLKGVLTSIDSDTSNAYAIDQVGNGSSHVAITMNHTTTGGLAGTYFRLTCYSATKWLVTGVNIGSGSVATPFATS